MIIWHLILINLCISSINMISLLETRKEDFITVARNGKPVARITLINEIPVSRRIGIARDKFTIKGDFDADNDEIANLMMGGTL